MSEHTVTDNSMMAAPVRIDACCRWCGQRLTVVGEHHMSPGVVGLRSLIYRHTDTGSEECTVRYKAQPYDPWDATRAFEKARATLTGGTA